MCQTECFGNYYRRCNHYIKQYESGNVKDCNSPHCAVSKAHCHTTESAQHTCTCPQMYAEHRKMLEMIQDWCEVCKATSWANIGPDGAERLW